MLLYNKSETISYLKYSINPTLKNIVSSLLNSENAAKQYGMVVLRRRVLYHTKDMKYLFESAKNVT